jgi:hypothetical protein
MTNVRSLRYLLALPLAWLVLLAPAAHAQASGKPTISEAVATQLVGLRPLAEAKDYAGALALLGRVDLATLGGYDEFVILQVRAQLLLALSDYASARPALERTLTIDAAAPAPGYLETAQRREIRYYLAQLLFQEASAQLDPVARRSGLARALEFARQWRADLPSPTVENEYFLASLIYSAALVDPAQADTALLREARGVTEATLTRYARVPVSIRLILVGVAQAQNDFATAADQLELIVEAAPTKTEYWSQLIGMYLSAAAASETRQDPAAARVDYLRAIVTFERAQRAGLLSSSRDQLNLISLHFNQGHFHAAARLLQAGLANGTLESSRRNWELLAGALQQGERPDEAIAALTAAAQRLPAEPQLRVQAAQLLYGREQLPRAYEETSAALAAPSGRLDAPGSTRVFAAYLAYELKRFADALRLLDEATTFPDAKPAEIKRLREALADAPAT